MVFRIVAASEAAKKRVSEERMNFIVLVVVRSLGRSIDYSQFVVGIK